MARILEGRIDRRTFVFGGAAWIANACRNGDDKPPEVTQTFDLSTNTPAQPTETQFATTENPTPSESPTITAPTGTPITPTEVVTPTMTVPVPTETPTESPTPTSSEFLATIVGLDFTCIDTMPESRDLAREGMTDEEIERSVLKVKETGATHIALGTAYNEEFLPFLKRWIGISRDAELNVWFRGNFSEFEIQHDIPSEGWFGYQHDREPEEHHDLTYTFIASNPEIFKSGDKFSPWPEPENGIMGNYYQNRQLYHDFLIKSFQNSVDAFREIRKDVEVLFSFNGDVTLSLDPEVVRELGTLVAMDHHIDDPRKMGEYITAAQQMFTDLRLVIGEYSAPRKEGESQASQDQNQAAFGIEIFRQFDNRELYGINYWPLRGGDRGLLHDDWTERPIYQGIATQYSHLRPPSDDLHLD